MGTFGQPRPHLGEVVGLAQVEFDNFLSDIAMEAVG